MTTYFVGNYYEKTGSVVTKYYYSGGQRIAMRKNGTLHYMFSDHLGSTSITTDSAGNVISELRYKPWGEVRYASGNTPTQFTFTGQRDYTADFGLMYFNARWLDPSTGRFAQADTIVPGGVQGLDRYAYANNNPLYYTDPDGHWAIPVAVIAVAVVFLKVIDYGWTAYDTVNYLAVAANSDNTPQVRKDAMANAAMAVGMEFIEPDDLSPVALPIDDIVRHGDEIGDGINAFLRAGDRSHTNPAIYKLRDSDVGSGLFTFDGSQVRSDDILSTLKSNDRVVEVPANGVPDGLEFVQTQGTTGNPLLDQNHWELRDPVKFNEMPWSQYKNWWNDTIAPRLAELAKGWKVFK